MPRASTSRTGSAGGVIRMTVRLGGAALALGSIFACGQIQQTPAGPLGTPPAYNRAAGQIVVQLFPSPGQLFPPITAIPEWTLYGDGTVVSHKGPTPDNPTGLFTAHLASADVDRILQTVVNQDAFFASTRERYGTFLADAGSTVLTVEIAGMRKQVVLGQSAGSSPDQQTTNVFAIAHYLRTYRVPQPVPYATPGAALVVYSPLPGSSDEGERAWPYEDIQLADAAKLACGLLPAGYPCARSPDGRSGLFGMYGARATELLRLIGATGRGRFEQNAYEFIVVAFPLLPDALHPSVGTASSVLVDTPAGMQRAPLIPPPQP